MKSVLQTTLAATTDHAPETKQGSTDHIRALLREQKRECQALRQHPVFKRLSRELKLNRRDANPYNEDEAPMSVEDLEAEAMNRLKEVIRRAGELSGKPQQGVWSPPGKAYQNLGIIQEVGLPRGSGWLIAMPPVTAAASAGMNKGSTASPPASSPSPHTQCQKRIICKLPPVARSAHAPASPSTHTALPASKPSA
jgi:hypothetical protein